MHPLTRRVAARAALAAGGTLVGALVARKFWVAPRPEPNPAGAPPLQTLAGLRPVSPPAKLPAFAWQAAGTDGARFRSIADHQGHGVVLNIWATWCDPCTRELPSLARLAASIAPAGIAVLPVSIDRGGAASVRAFFGAHAITGLPVLVDPQSSALASLGLGGIPTTFLIDGNGDIRARFEGAADWGTPDALASVRRFIGS